MWLAPPAPTPAFSGKPRRYDVAIAVPARDEAQSITACLAAIDAAAGRAAAWLDTLVVVVSANNCADDTVAIAKAFRPQAFRLVVDAVVLPADRAHAGGARRAALDLAARLLPAGGVLATTDADSAVAPDWLAALLAEFVRGADAVAGAITLAPAERAQLPPLPGRDAEWQLAERLAILEALLDPLAHDPSPRHIWAWGANFALSVAAYATIGGLPVVPLAEDRALADVLLRHDLRLRRSTAPLVYTSARIVGRAPGGFADLISGFANDCDLPCDAALEPVTAFVRRLRWRARLRAVHAAMGRDATIVAARPLLPEIHDLPMTGRFGALWATIEAQSPMLVRQRLYPAQLARELRNADRQIARFKPAAANPADNPAAAAAR